MSDAPRWEQPAYGGDEPNDDAVAESEDGLQEPWSASGRSHQIDLAWLGPDAFEGSAGDDRCGPITPRGTWTLSSRIVFWFIAGLAAMFLFVAMMLGLAAALPESPAGLGVPLGMGAISGGVLALLVWFRWFHHPVRTLSVGPSGFFLRRGKRQFGARWDAFRRVSLELSSGPAQSGLQLTVLRLAPRDPATLGRLQASGLGKLRSNGDMMISLGGGVSQFHDVRWALTDAGVHFHVRVDGLLIDQRSLPPARPRPTAPGGPVAELPTPE